MRYKQIIMEAKRATNQEFIDACVRILGPQRAARMSIADIAQVSQESQLQCPVSLKATAKVDKHHWDMSGGEGQDIEGNMSKDLGIDVDKTPDMESDPEMAQLNQLAKAKEVSKLASSGKMFLMGKGAKGRFFRIPGLDNIAAQLERLLSRQLHQNGELSMEDKYEELIEYVELIAGRKSERTKSLLLTGTSSSGKTFSVMSTIKKLGLVEGKDYMKFSGSISDPELYKLLLQQLNSITIFDDCDSVFDSKEGRNILKGALDTNDVREITRSVGGLLNVTALSSDERNTYVNAVSNALNFKDTVEDVEIVESTLLKMRLLKTVLADFEKQKKKAIENGEYEDSNEASGGDDVSNEVDNEFPDVLDGEEAPRVTARDTFETKDGYTRDDIIMNFARERLPNKFDFQGRVIFISNLTEEMIEPAIVMRALCMDLSFDSGEMLDFIMRISDKIPSVLSNEEKTEVLEFLHGQYVSGKLEKPINFRTAMQAFDLRLTPNWQKFLSRW